MGKLFKFLRPYGGAVLAILCVLVVQAYCDLSLPTYTSDIVNVGLQQKGIEEKVPEVIGEEDLNQLLLFVPSEKQETVKEAYETGPAPSEAYEGNVLEISGEVKEDEGRMEELSEILGKPMLLCSGFASGSEFSPEMGMQMEASQREAIVKEIEEQLSAMPETMVEQSAAVYIGNVYEKLGIDLDRRETEYILSTGAKMLALALLGMLASILVGLIASRVGARMGQSLRKDVFRKVVSFSNGEFDKFSTASLITRSTNDIQQIQLLTVMILRMVLYAPIMAAGGIFKVFRTNVDMSWIIALAVALIVSVVAVLFVVVMPKFKVVQNMVDRLNLVSREILTGLQVIRAFSTEQYEEKRFDSANRDLTKTNLFVNRAMTFMMPLMMLIMNGIAVLIVWVGGHSINDGSMQVGDMMAFIQYTMQIIMSFLMICMISVMLPRAAVSADRVDEILTSGTLIHDPESPKDFAENAAGEVVFDHVSFRYPGAEEDVLHDISFTAKPGETTAFIGSTGSGKSTLVNLIPRFYDVTEGRILIDGVDLRDVSQHDLRDRLGYVPQKSILFSGTIDSNIRYGKADATQQEIEEAAAIAQAAEFIETKEEGYNAPIAQGGTNVSGGQKQRLSIARAIAKQPEILIFDDSFVLYDDERLRTALRWLVKAYPGQIIIFTCHQREAQMLTANQIPYHLISI